MNFTLSTVTRRYRVLLEEPKVAGSVNKCLSFYGIRRCITVSTIPHPPVDFTEPDKFSLMLWRWRLPPKQQYLYTRLYCVTSTELQTSKMKSVHALKPCFIDIRPNVILTFTPTSPKWSLQISELQICTNYFHMPLPSGPLWLDHNNNILFGENINYEIRHDSVFSDILLDLFSLSTRLSVCVYPLYLEPGTHIWVQLISMDDNELTFEAHLYNISPCSQTICLAYSVYFVME